MAIQRIRLDVAMLDGTEYEDLVVTTRDRMFLGAHAARQKWGNLAEDSDRSLTFLAWQAMKRLGHFDGNFEQFVDQSETVSGKDISTVDPTSTETSATSSPV